MFIKRTNKRVFLNRTDRADVLQWFVTYRVEPSQGRGGVCVRWSLQKIMVGGVDRKITVGIQNRKGSLRSSAGVQPPFKKVYIHSESLRFKVEIIVSFH